MLVPGLYSFDLAASWHMLVPPLLLTWMSSTPRLTSRLQLTMLANPENIDGDTCHVKAGHVLD